MEMTRILVVEDESVTALSLKANLIELGYEVTGIVASGAQAISAAAAMQPDLILMDITLVGPMNGIEAASEIRKAFSIPIVFLTAHTDTGTIEKAKITEPFAYLPKPCSSEALVSAIEIAIFKNEADAERRKTEQALRESEQRYRLLVETASEGILVAQGDRLRFVNTMMQELTGYTEEEMLSLPFMEFIHPEDQALVKDNHRKRLNGEAVDARYHFRMFKKDTTTNWVEMSGVKIEWEGRPATLNFVTDITRRKQVEEALIESNRKLELLSITDGLTGIANRRHFDEVLAQEHARHTRSGAELSLIMLDIDRFKEFNDTYGHLKGDECLRRITRVIADCTSRPADLAARYGGEEFACILPETDRTGAVAIAEKIRRSIMALAIPHMGSTVADCVTASLGVATTRCTVDSLAVDIVAQVDELLYRAKSCGRNRVEFVGTHSGTLTSADEIRGNLVQLFWRDGFGCGNLLIDSQHQSLFHLSNELLEAVIAARPSGEIAALMSRLLEDIGQHFRDEEMILEAVSFPGLIQHAEEHAKLIIMANDVSRKFKAGTLSLGDVFQFLVYEVVMQHMLKEDRKFFPFTRVSHR